MSRNKIIVVALTLLLCATTAQADFLCVSKRVSINSGGTSRNYLRFGKKIKVKKKCGRGYKKIYDFNKLVSSKADASNLGNYVSKEELVEVLSKYASPEEVATLKEGFAQNSVEVANLVETIANKADVADLEALATKADLANKADTSALENLATKEEVNTALVNKADTSALENFATKEEVNTALANKADTSALENLATKEEVNTALANKADTSALENLATKEEVNTALANKADTSALENLATKAEVNTALANKADASALENLATKEELSGKADADSVYTKEEVDGAVSTAVATVEERVAELEDNQDGNSLMLEDLAGHYDMATGNFDFASDAIPAGKTVTGVSYIYFHDASSFESDEHRYGVAGLPTKAPADIMIGGEEQCTGNGENPTAAEGYFCVYKLNVPDNTSDCTYAVTASKLGNSRQGVLVHVEVTRHTGRICYGSKTNGNGVVAWAYTAPASSEEGNN